ncbi:hypothetical protein SG34_027660 [Thalassomonas viridans]|uniref:Uncharacterized protein n=1 Tax=Thalassomonas viridans TaxID=137584 RepID=A0AAE9Z2U2_9GAMM|nr:hypothetical protein [Thalassomonas viridans]WDE05034.1 hypothetical protein SG34_027660 [Thalassomonas viridans]
MKFRDKFSILSTFFIAVLFMLAFLNRTLHGEPSWHSYSVINYECRKNEKDYYHNFILNNESLYAYAATPCLSDDIVDKLMTSKKISFLSDEVRFYQIKVDNEILFNQGNIEASIETTRLSFLFMSLIGFVMCILQFRRKTKREKREGPP